MEQAWCRIWDTDCRLGNHAPCIPVPVQVKQTPGHQRMSQRSNMMREKQTAALNRTVQFALMDGNTECIPSRPSGQQFFRVFAARGWAWDGLPHFAHNIYYINKMEDQFRKGFWAPWWRNCPEKRSCAADGYLVVSENLINCHKNQ
jgi:hypothetical protein